MNTIWDDFQEASISVKIFMVCTACLGIVAALLMLGTLAGLLIAAFATGNIACILIFVISFIWVGTGAWAVFNDEF